jgi:hypothetical protein
MKTYVNRGFRGLISEGFWPYPPYLVILFRCYSDPTNDAFLVARFATVPHRNGTIRAIAALIE